MTHIKASDSPIFVGKVSKTIYIWPCTWENWPILFWWQVYTTVPKIMEAWENCHMWNLYASTTYHIEIVTFSYFMLVFVPISYLTLCLAWIASNFAEGHKTSLLCFNTDNSFPPYAHVIKTESARTSSITWTKLCTKIIYTLLETSVLLFQIYYQKKSFLTTPNIENKFCSSTEFSESLERLLYKITTFEILPIVYVVLVNFEIHFLRKSIMKSGNINFSWTKIDYQNN